MGKRNLGNGIWDGEKGIWKKGETISFRMYSKRLNIKFDRQEYGGRRKNKYENNRMSGYEFLKKMVLS